MVGEGGRRVDAVTFMLCFSSASRKTRTYQQDAVIFTLCLALLTICLSAFEQDAVTFAHCWSGVSKKMCTRQQNECVIETRCRLVIDFSRVRGETLSHSCTVIQERSDGC